jgi:hypothetical protein
LTHLNFVFGVAHQLCVRQGKKQGPIKSDDSISTVLEDDEEMGDSTDESRLQSLLEKYESPNSRDTKIKRSGKKGHITGSVKDVGHATPPQTFIPSKVLTSLRAMNAPSELRQGTLLLLQSSLLDEVTANLLMRDILDQPLEGASPNAIDDGENGEGGEEGKNEGRIDSGGLASLDQSQSLTESALTANNDPVAIPLGNENVTNFSEVPYLFAPPNVIDEMLRPSIFTMHSMSPDSQ